MTTNPLLSDRDVEFLLYEVHDIEALTKLPAFADHSRETFDLLLGSVRRLAREALFPAYRAMDIEPPVYFEGRMKTHPRMRALYAQMSELGMIHAHRSPEVGGQSLPGTVYAMATAYLMAANTTAYGYIGLTSGAAHLIEKFGSAELKTRFMEPMLQGRWTGTMALTEPQAGSSLSDVKTRATPQQDGSHLLVGNKLFISGGDNDFAENIVHLTLARIDGAPAGTKGISLFAVPRLREQGATLVDNDVAVAGAIHKLGARGIPSCVLNYGERNDCRGWLVGEPHRGLASMFHMMNEARIMVGLGGAATASVAYQESLNYAKDRTQGRLASEKDPSKPPVAIIEHADVRRMLLRQKAIVEGSLSLIVAVSKHADSGGERSGLLVDLLTPVVKTFPAERGFEANALAVQVHGGYGYSQDYLVEAWLRDQKLNSLHEGTTGIQSLDLLGRKVMQGGGAGLKVFAEEVKATIDRASGVEQAWCTALQDALDDVIAATMELGALGAGGNVEMMLRHSADYLEMFSIVVIGWQWLEQARVAKDALQRGSDAGFYQGKLAAAQYWTNTEVTRVRALAALCRSGDDSYARMQPSWF